MRSIAFFRLLLLATIVVSGCGTQQAASRTQANELLGSWRAISERVSAAGIEIVWTIDDGQIVITDGDGNEISRSDYRIDPMQTPKHINMTIRGEGILEDRPGIYQIDEGRLHLAFSVDGSPRPTKFDDPELLIFERVEAR
jgi:uncharacterized protein (TIGR03067 family)